jgi:hypothetical protein
VTGQSDFTEDEWKLVLQGPTSAGLIVIAAQRGGSIRESFSMANSYAEARKAEGESQLLDEIAAAKPEVDRGGIHSPGELKLHGIQHLRDAVELLEQKASPDEVDAYKRFVVELAQRVAEAHREGFMGMTGDRVSDAERAAVEEIAQTVGVPVAELDPESQ